MHVDYKLDESYTPKQVSVRAGHTYHDLKVRAADPCTLTKVAGVGNSSALAGRRGPDLLSTAQTYNRCG